MARTPQTARKSTGGIAPRRFLGVRAAGVHVRVAGWHPPGIDVWHPLLIAAADQGGRTRVFAGLAAKQERVGDACYRVNRNGDHRHPTSAAGGAAAAGADVVTSPFPATSSFGLLPYAAFRGHEEAVAFFCAAGFDPKGTGRVRCSRHRSSRQPPQAAHGAAAAHGLPVHPCTHPPSAP